MPRPGKKGGVGFAAIDALIGTPGHLAAAHAPRALFPDPPGIRFRPAFDRCPHCNAGLRVHRVRDRHPQILDPGPFVARETTLRCDRCPDRPVFRSEELDAPVGLRITVKTDTHATTVGLRPTTALI